jgi:lipopolysaccharide export system protein LptA
MPFINRFSSLLLSLALCAAFPAAAERADRDKPMNAEADALRYDDLKQSTVFTGNVVITKGTTLVRGGRVDVTQDAQGYQQVVVTASPGKLAYYRTKRDGVDEHIEGEGEVIEYDSRADVVRFIRQAVLRRYVGSTLADESTGGLIRYDNVTDVFTVDSGPQRNVGNPNGRVRATLSPRGTAVAPIPAPAAPVAPGAPRLRLSPELDSGAKPAGKP